MKSNKNAWNVDEMLTEYTQSYTDLKNAKSPLDEQVKELNRLNQPVDASIEEARTLMNSMLESMKFAMDWMETGRNPDQRRGVDKRAIYHRQFFESIDVIPDITDKLYDINSKELRMTAEEEEYLAIIFSTWSHRERVCFIAHEVNNESFQKIADTLKVSKSTVQTHIARARGKIKKVLREKSA